MGSESHPSQLWFGSNWGHKLAHGVSQAAKGTAHGLSQAAKETTHGLSQAAKGTAHGLSQAGKKIEGGLEKGGKYFVDHNPGINFAKGEIDAFKKKDYIGGLTGGAGMERAQDGVNDFVHDEYSLGCDALNSQKCHKLVDSKGFRIATTVATDAAIIVGTGGLGAEGVAAEEAAVGATELSEAAVGVEEAAEADLVVEGAATDEVYGSAATRTSKVKAWMQKAPVKFLRFSAEGSLLGTALQLGLPYLLSSPGHRADAPPEVRQAADRFVALVVLVVAVALLLYLLAR